MGGRRRNESAATVSSQALCPVWPVWARDLERRMVEVLAGNMGVAAVCYVGTTGEVAAGVLSKSQVAAVEPEEYLLRQPVSS